MNGAVAPRPLLLFAYGNPSRGDDALGPELVNRLKGEQDAGAYPELDLLTDFQPQVEHALDLRQRSRVLIADASLRARPPFELTRMQPLRDPSFTTHALTPAAVLQVYREIEGAEPPATFLLAIRGYRFALGEGLSAGATTNLTACMRWLRRLLATEASRWDALLRHAPG